MKRVHEPRGRKRDFLFSSRTDMIHGCDDDEDEVELLVRGCCGRLMEEIVHVGGVPVEEGCLHR